MIQALAIRPKELPAATGLSRALCYRLLAQGVIPSVRVGRAILVPVDRLKEWLEGRTEGGRGR